MNKFLRLLLLAPAACSSILSLAMVKPAHAASSGWVQVSKDTVCLHATAHATVEFTCKRVGSEATRVVDITKPATAAAAQVQRVNQKDDPTATAFNMTDEESDAAIALFGCDCPVCVRSLRQLRSMIS